MTNIVQPGSRVTLHYTLSLRDGTPVDTTRERGPATFTIGSGELIGLLEHRLLGLVPGERRHFEISATEGEAMRQPDAVQHLPRAEFPANLDPEPGSLIAFTAPNGEEIAGQVLAVTDTEVVVDFTHPLIGRDLVFDVEIIAVEPA